MHQFNRQDCMHDLRHDLFKAFACKTDNGRVSRFRKNKLEFIVCDTDLLPTGKHMK